MNRDQHRAEIARRLADLGAVQLCARLDLLAGAKRQTTGDGVSIRCPSHNENSASCSVTVAPTDRLIRVHCFGGCGLSGDGFNLVAAVRGLTLPGGFSEVIRACEELLGMPALSEEVLPVQGRRAPASTLSDDTFDAMARRILELCPLDKSVDGAAYMRKRGLYREALGKLGCLPRPDEQGSIVRSLVAEFGQRAWVDSGLAHSESEDRFFCPWHRVLIPWRTWGVDGQITNLQRRHTFEKSDRGPKYISTTGRKFPAPFGIEDAIELIGDGVSLVVVEGAFDALKARTILTSEGLDVAVIGLAGVGRWSSDWAKLGTGRVVRIGLDHDPAGESASTKLANDFHAAGALRVTRLRTIAKDWAATEVQP